MELARDVSVNRWYCSATFGRGPFDVCQSYVRVQLPQRIEIEGIYNAARGVTAQRCWRYAFALWRTKVAYDWRAIGTDGERRVGDDCQFGEDNRGVTGRPVASNRPLELNNLKALALLNDFRARKPVEESGKKVADSLVYLIARLAQSVERIIIGVLALGRIFDPPELSLVDSLPCRRESAICSRRNNEQIMNRYRDGKTYELEVYAVDGGLYGAFICPICGTTEVNAVLSSSQAEALRQNLFSLDSHQAAKHAIGTT